jgi:hypothetical protein
VNTRNEPIFLPDGENAIHDGIEHEPTGGKALIDTTDCVMLSLDHQSGLYNTPGGLILSGSPSSQRYVGASPAVLITQQFGRHLAISLSYYHFYRGGFLTSQAGTKDVDYFSTWTSYTF